MEFTLSKKCSTCNEIKPLNCFCVKNKNKDGYNHQCRQCVSKCFNKYYYRNKKKLNKKTKEWFLKNKDWIIKNRLRYNEKQRERYKNSIDLREKIKKYHHQYYIKNQDHELNRSKQWAKNHKGLAVAKVRTYQLKKYTPKWANKKKIKEIYIKAAELTIITGIKHDVDHITPLKGKDRSGLHWEGNLQILTMKENRKKSNNI